MSVIIYKVRHVHYYTIWYNILVFSYTKHDILVIIPGKLASPLEEHPTNMAVSLDEAMQQVQLVVKKQHWMQVTPNLFVVDINRFNRDAECRLGQAAFRIRTIVFKLISRHLLVCICQHFWVSICQHFFCLHLRNFFSAPTNIFFLCTC